MVTAPLHKGVIIEGGFPHFTGHTEWLRDACGVDEVVMLLATDAALHAKNPLWQGSGDLRVALVTTHLPLRDVADAITFERVTQISRLLAADLRRQFGILNPRIAVCGLNPHAGEEGHLGREELDTIIPALDALRADGLDIQGPLPADTLFTPRHLAGVDAVLAMYHDQGLYYPRPTAGTYFSGPRHRAGFGGPRHCRPQQPGRRAIACTAACCPACQHPGRSMNQPSKEHC